MKVSSSKKILVVAESIDVEDSSGSKANVALIKNLESVGFELLVYHYTRKEIKLGSIPCKAIKEKKNSVNYFLSRFQRKIQHWVKLNLAKYLEPNFGFSFTFFNDVASIQHALLAEKNFEPDLILTLSKGASFRPHYALLKLSNYHSKWMAYIHDPYPFYYYPEPYNWAEPGYKMKINFFKEMYRKCKWVAYPSILLKDWMNKKYHQPNAKGIVIPHQINQDVKNSLKLADFFNSEKFTLMHAGNLMKQRPPFYLIRAFQKFINEVPTAKADSLLLLIGNASYHKKELQKTEKRASNLIVRDYLQYQAVQALQKKVSVNIILESKAEISPFLPGKFPHCIAAEKPILLLGPEQSESLRLLGGDYPYWSEIDDEDTITEKITSLYNLWLQRGKDLRMKREDLKKYLSAGYLKTVIDKTFN